ncbi:MAG TPA: DUF1549 and DUF1553 domain-containing protein [Planctomycetaceae bacterium]|nr:DUF1549 and DUF1553 domain-containing protein [Planctomycetaceae bacterium]
MFSGKMLFTAACLFASMAAVASAQSPVANLNVYPADVNLTTTKDRQLVVVQAVYENGLTQDVSSQAAWTLANPALVRRDGNTLWPVADGQTELKIDFGGKSVMVPVKVEKAAELRPISFKLDVMPVFMKAGCNSGSCHGAARGKDGFRLSLFGFDPNGDHFRLAREMSGRRLDLAVPEASLVVEKSVGAVPHTGGKRFAPDSELCQELVRWISAGCPQDPAEVATVVGVEIYPKQAVLDGTGATQQVTVRAKYSDGTDRDVTSLALFLSNNDNSAVIDNSGVVTAGARGEAFIMARFSTFTVGSQYIVLPKGLNFTFPQIPEANYIDTLVDQKLKKLRISPSEICTDEVFVRRIYLDLVGMLPTPEEYDRYMASTDPEKRNKLIDELLNRKEFTEIWVAKWAEWLMMRSNNQISYKAMLLYYNWLSDQVANNVPLDKMVQQLLGANGGTFKVPATNYYQNETDMLKVSENVAQVFMGMRIQCAQCHNHPFDRWTQDDYYSFAAFFSQIGRKTGEDYRETIVFNSGGGDVRHPVDGRVMAPAFLGGGPADVAGKDRRVVMANWLASPQNPYFAQNFANRVWSHFFGIGIIEPIDDVRISNPASNPELLQELAAKFTSYNYDFKQLVRDICRSQTYQRSTARNESNATDEMNFAHANLRRIKAESLLDIISQVTNTKDKFRGLPLGARAMQIADGTTSTYFLTTFGRATRETVCSCEVKMEPTLSQALHLLNGETTNDKLRAGRVIDVYLEQKLEPLQIVEKLYVTCLSRKPTPQELDNVRPLFNEGANVKQSLEDIYWALLNSREFLFNH